MRDSLTLPAGLVAAAASLLIASQAAHAQTASKRFDVPAEDLADALDQVARVAGVSLLFDRDRVKTIHYPAVHGVLTVEQALALLLQGSGLAAKQVGPGNYVLVPVPAFTAPPPDAAIPDILVIGTRSQNTDIQRRADDVQPYRVIDSAQIASAQAGTLDELLKSRLAANQVAVSSAQQSGTGGKVQSAVNLRGLGTAQTLVLVDGRRLPSSPTDNAFLQSDIMGLPVSAIERVETYGGTAGAMYGPGAIGGVVNIVLKQDLPRLWIEGQGAITDRGDGAQWRVTGGFSFASTDDRTRISVIGSYSKDYGLAFGDRSFVADLRRATAGGLPLGQNVNVIARDGLPLTLIPALGGQSLGSNITNIPVNSGGAGGNEVALLRLGAGKWDYRLSQDGTGADQTLLTPFRTYAAIVNARQKIGDRFEVFANFLFTADGGTAVVPATPETYFSIAPGKRGNPFINPIIIAVPTPGFDNPASAVLTTLRGTIGLIVQLPSHWSLEADAALGRMTDWEYGNPELVTIKKTNVFSPGTKLADKLAKTKLSTRYTVFLFDRLHDFNLHVAGPLFSLPGGPATLTVSAEHRDEFSPALQQSPAPVAFTNEHGQMVDSLLAEARLPVVSRTSPVVLLKGLELQLAVRGDRYRIDLPEMYFTNPVDPALSDKNNLRSQGTTLALTFGAKVTPIDGLTFRGSFASGYQPPTPRDLVPDLISGKDKIVDPKRPNDKAKHKFALLEGGSPKVRPELAATFSAGVIAEPRFLPGFRLSIDYTRILERHQISEDRSGDEAYFIEHEADFSGRIIRAPLTAEDIAKGYIGGAIEQIDTGAINSGRSTFQAIDFDLAYEHSFAIGRVGLHTSVTWVPSYKRQDDPFGAVLEYAGQSDGQLNWKGAAGAEWHRGSIGVTIDVQYYGAYDVTVARPTEYLLSNKTRVLEQGSTRIAPQAYVDIGFEHRLSLGGGTAIKYRLGIKNLFDKTPPVVIPLLFGDEESWPGYSTYGDPRGRRAVLTLSASL